MRSTHTSMHLDSSAPDLGRAVGPLVAGAALGLLGLANVAVGFLAVATDLVRLTPATAGALAVLGTVTVALGVLVARGVRWATVLALAVSVGLFVARAADGGGASGPAPALVTLALVVVPLVVALRTRRGRDGA